jgi:acyl dehydratase
MAIKYYYEDLAAIPIADVGTRSISSDDIVRFAREYDPQPFHVNEEAAKHSVFGGLIASGWMTCAIVMRMMCDSYLLESASLGSPGIDNVRWLLPVRPGDTITVVRKMLEARKSASKPDRGIIRSRWEVCNQKGELVMTMEGLGMFGCRPAAAA